MRGSGEPLGGGVHRRPPSAQHDQSRAEALRFRDPRVEQKLGRTGSKLPIASIYYPSPGWLAWLLIFSIQPCSPPTLPSVLPLFPLLEVRAKEPLSLSLRDFWVTGLTRSPLPAVHSYDKKPFIK